MEVEWENSPFGKLFREGVSILQNQSEKAFAANARCTLQEALSEAAEDERVARWLFSDKDYPYIENGPSLSTQAFKSSVALRMSHHIDSMPGSAPITSSLSSSSSSSPSWSSSSSSSSSPLSSIPLSSNSVAASGATDGRDFSESVDTAAEILMTPACQVGDKLYGYGMTFPAFAQPAALNLSIPLPGAMLDKAHINSRFMFDRRTKRLIVVMHAVTSTLSLIISRSFQPQSDGERFVFGVENKNYSYGSLPDRPVLMFSNINYSLSGPCGAQSSQNTDSENGPLSDWLNIDDMPDGPLLSDDLSVLPPPSPSSLDKASLFMSANDGLPSCPDTVLGDFNHQCNDKDYFPENGRGDVNHLTDAISELHLNLSKNQLNHDVKRDVLDPITSEMRERLTLRIRSCFDPSVTELRSQCVEYAARCYYAASLSAVTGGKRVRVHVPPEGLKPPFQSGWPNQNPNHTIAPLSSKITFPHSNAPYPRLIASTHPAPRPIAALGSHVPIVPVAFPAQMAQRRADTRSQQEIKLEEKRRRNRESAARSNLKRKLREELQEKELKSLKARVDQLRQRQQYLLEENSLLRSVVR